MEYRKGVESGNCEQAAFSLGKALHYLQDSYSESHTERVGGRIHMFQNYGLQSAHLHEGADNPSPGSDLFGNAVGATSSFICMASDKRLSEGQLRSRLANVFFQLAPGAVAGNKATLSRFAAKPTRIPQLTMSRLPRYSVVALLGLQLALAFSGCSQPGLEKKPWQRGELEVAPGNFIEVENRYITSDEGSPPISFRDLHVFGTPQKGKTFSETVELRIHWNGTNVHWKGHSGPLNLRAFEGRLFLITFDRVSKGTEECEFRYYGQEGNELKEIPPAQFPKAIAGENIIADRYFGGFDRQIDAVKLELDADPKDVYFRQSMTAYIWNHLTTGEQHEQSRRKPQISQTLLEEYVRTNKPIKLTAIIRNVSNGGDTKSPGGGDR